MKTVTVKLSNGEEVEACKFSTWRTASNYMARNPGTYMIHSRSGRYITSKA